MAGAGKLMQCANPFVILVKTEKSCIADGGIESIVRDG